VYVDYVLFLKRLAERAAKHAGEDGETRVHERHVRAATVVSVWMGSLGCEGMRLNSSLWR